VGQGSARKPCRPFSISPANIEKFGGLDAKTFQLVYMALQASRGAVASVSAHAAFAKRAGATREEVRGAI
jgi:AhpD family alkylhydroperoxidase